MVTNKKAHVSVIIPTYNGEAFINRTIKSVLDQTISDYEIIVINDGSTDSTKKILSNWKKRDSRIKIIDTKGFGGPVEPINLGIKDSSGKYIAFLDHDDTWENNKLEIILEKFKKIEADMIVSAVYLQDKKTKKISKLENNNIESILSGKYFNTFTSIVIKRDLTDSVGFLDEKVKILPDYEFIIRTISRGKKVLFLKEPLATHFFHENNLSSPKISLEKRSLDLEYILLKHNSYLKNYKKIQSYIYNAIGTISMKINQRGKAVKYFLKSFLIYPFNVKSLLKATLCILGEKTYNYVENALNGPNLI